MTNPTYEFILSVLEANDGRCCDDENDRECLAEAIVESLKAGEPVVVWSKEEE